MLQRVKMLKTQKGVRDGEIHPVAFMEGEEYEIGSELLQSFIELGVVELIEQPDEKALAGAPANKARKAAPENKSR